MQTLVDSETVRLMRLSTVDDTDRGVFSSTCIVREEDLQDLREGDFVLLGVLDLLAEVGHSRVAEIAARAGISGFGWPEWMTALIPGPFVEDLARGGIPSYALPDTARLADLVEVIANAHAAPDATRFQRFVHMQQQLVDALLDDPPVEALVRRLAALTGGIAGVTDERGGVEAASGVLPFVLLRQEAAESNARDGVIEIAGWVAAGRRLRSLPGEPARWLFVAKRQPTFASTYVRAAVGVTASLLDGTRRINEITADQDLATRAFVLREALDTEPYENSDLLETRAGALGIDFRTEARVFELHLSRALSAGPRGVIGLRDAVLAAFTVAPTLVLEREDGATVLAQCASTDFDSGIDRLLRSVPGLLIGIGRPMKRIGETRVSWHDATLAAQTARRTRGRSVVRYDDFDLGTRLLADVDRTDMSYWVDELLGPLRDRPILMEALTAYFEQNLDIMKAAKQLEIHHNTLRYRLVKIEESLGGPIQSPARIASLHLALSADQAPQSGLKPLRPTVTPPRRAADIGDTDVLRGGAAAPVQFGVGEPPVID